MHASWLLLLSLLPAVLDAANTQAPARPKAPETPKPPEIPKRLKRLDRSGKKCPQTWTRKEWRNLDAKQQKAYLDAVLKIRSRKTPTTPTIVDEMVNLHGTISSRIHWTACFLPWHRFFLTLYEELLQEVDVSIAQPYWHMTYDSQSSVVSPIFSDTAFGGTGRRSDSCVTDGTFKGMTTIYPSRRCLMRKFDSNRIFKSPDYINAKMASSRTFEQMQEFVEGGIHPDPHYFIGEDAATMYSPNEPLFFCLHAYVDKLWADWQKRDPSNLRSYGGTNANGRRASPSDKLEYFTDYTINNLFSTEADFCYVYQDLIAEPNKSQGSQSKVKVKPNAEAEVGKWGMSRFLVRRREDHIQAISVKCALERSRTCGVPVTPPIIVPVDDTIEVKPGPATIEELPKGHIPMLKLRLPDRVPDEWFKLNKIPLDVAKRLHDESVSITQQVNKIPGYISPAALWNREELLAKSIERKFKIVAFVNGTLIEFKKYDSDPKVAAEEIKDKLQASVVSDYIQKPVGEIAEQMVKVIGQPFYDTLNPVNPYRPRRLKEVGFGREDFRHKALPEVIKEKLKKGYLLRSPRKRHPLSQGLCDKSEKWREAYLKKLSQLRPTMTKKL